MTKMAAMPIYDKKLKKILLRNQKANDLEIWYASPSARKVSGIVVVNESRINLTC